MNNSIGPQRGMPRVLRSVWVSILLFTCSMVFAPNPNTLIRDIVLVHGAWADASGWQGVYGTLVTDGSHVSMVQEPETSFKEYVTATQRVLALQDGPCILVGHSMA
ncbi:MAG TPA: alpha/beta hydrolase, partial [Terriglobales bacterium]